MWKARSGDLKQKSCGLKTTGTKSIKAHQFQLTEAFALQVVAFDFYVKQIYLKQICFTSCCFRNFCKADLSKAGLLYKSLLSIFM